MTPSFQLSPRSSWVWKQCSIEANFYTMPKSGLVTGPHEGVNCFCHDHYLLFVPLWSFLAYDFPIRGMKVVVGFPHTLAGHPLICIICSTHCAVSASPTLVVCTNLVEFSCKSQNYSTISTILRSSLRVKFKLISTAKELKCATWTLACALTVYKPCALRGKCTFVFVCKVVHHLDTSCPWALECTRGAQVCLP